MGTGWNQTRDALEGDERSHYTAPSLIPRGAVNPFTPTSDLIDFTLSDARRSDSSKGDPLGVKGLKSFLSGTLYLRYILPLAGMYSW